MPSDVYCVDTSSFIELGRHYPRDVFESAWATLESLMAAGRLIAPREVRRELEKTADDDVSKWSKANGGMFIDIDDQQGVVVGEIASRFAPIAELLKAGPYADPVLVALAVVRTKGPPPAKCFVVTEERMRGDGSHKIPNVCKLYEIDCGTLLDLFRREGCKF